MTSSRTIRHGASAGSPRRLLAHLRRWQKMDMEIGVDYQRIIGGKRVHLHGAMTHVIHYGGEPVKKVRKAFENMAARLGWSDDETPHVLRHTCATWGMQNRADAWELSGYLGMSLKILLEVYGHHHPDHQSTVSEAMDGPRK